MRLAATEPSFSGPQVQVVSAAGLMIDEIRMKDLVYDSKVPAREDFIERSLNKTLVLLRHSLLHTADPSRVLFFHTSLELIIRPLLNSPVGARILQATNPPDKGVNRAGTGHNSGSRGRTSPGRVQRKGLDAGWGPVTDPLNARGI